MHRRCHKGLPGLFLIFLMPVVGFANIPPSLQSSSDPQNLVQNLGLDAWQLGPLSLGGKYDALLGMIFNAQYVQAYSDSAAMGLIGEYGPNQYRFNATVGAQVWQNMQIKLSGEYLSQVLPFSFDSGNINQRVGQGAYGFEFQQTYDQALLQSLEAGGYWAQAPSVSLPSIAFNSGGFNYTNERNIAGSISKGLNIGSDFAVTSRTDLKAKAYYDQVTYNTRFSDGANENNLGLGGALSLEQVLSERMKLLLKDEQRALYHTYDVQYLWAPAFAKTIGLELSLVAERLVSKNATPSSNSIGLELHLLDRAPNYTASKTDGLNDLSAWVKKPAVYMDRVLVVAEQRTTLNSPELISLSINEGPIAGGTTLTLTGTQFVSGQTTVYFGGVEGTMVNVINSTTLTVVTPAHAAGTVNVVITTAGGSSTLSDAYTYLAPPSILGLASSGGYVTGGTSVTITGANFTDVSAVLFGSVPASSFVITSSTSITAISPPATSGPGVVDIHVTTPGGMSGSTSADAFTYTAPPRIIFVSSATYTGDLGGFTGADAKCNSDPARPLTGFAAGYNYRALLNGNNATTLGVSYYRPDGATLIATATGGNLKGLSGLSNSIATSSASVWTGGESGPNNCSSWTGSGNGSRGSANSALSIYWSNGSVACATNQHLYCVSQ